MARDICGRELLEVELVSGGTVRDLRAALVSQVPALSSLLGTSLFAVGSEYVPDDFTLKEGVEVACIPPVSGG